MKTKLSIVFLILSIPYLLADLYIIPNNIFKLEGLDIDFFYTSYGYIFAFCLFFMPIYFAGLVYLLIKNDFRKMALYCLPVFAVYFISFARILF